MRRRPLSAKFFILLAAGAGLLAACGPPPGPSVRVTRVNSNTQIDMSGKWNDADSNQVARVMIKDCLARPWAARFRQKTGRDPVIRLGKVRNRTLEKIIARAVNQVRRF